MAAVTPAASVGMGRSGEHATPPVVLRSDRRRQLIYRRSTPAPRPTTANPSRGGDAKLRGLHRRQPGYRTTHKLDPRNAADAKANPDRDGLTNLREYRLKGLPRDEDSDNDGQDDGDEVAIKTNIRDADSDDDGRKDGDEDYDRDRIANEDEDDATETCAADDDDRDRDNVDDEDENEQGQRVLDADSDDDGVADGAEDRDEDGIENEDEDDVDLDACSPDRDGDGEDDEDEGDRYGTIASFDTATSQLVVASVSGFTFTLLITPDTEIEFEYPDNLDCEDETEPSAADLVQGQQIAELELEDDGTVEEIELLAAVCPAPGTGSGEDETEGED